MDDGRIERNRRCNALAITGREFRRLPGLREACVDTAGSPPHSTSEKVVATLPPFRVGDLKPLASMRDFSDPRLGTVAACGPDVAEHDA